jgi:hypothetical protein
MGLVKRQRLPTRTTGGSQNDEHGDDFQHDDDDDETSKAPWRHWTEFVETLTLQGRIITITTKRAIACFCVGVFILVRCNTCFSLSYRHDKTIRVHHHQPPIMVQWESSSSEQLFTNATSLRPRMESEPSLRYIQNRENRYWINHEIRKHKDPEQVPEGCVAEADWMSDVHPLCNNVHEVDMTDFLFNPQRTTTVRIRSEGGRHHHHRRRQKFRLIGKGGFRAAFLFYESQGTRRRVLKTLLYRHDRNFTPRTFDRMRRDAVASEQLTFSKYVVDIYGYCGMSALVDYSDSDDMLSLFENKTTSPNKDELFQIAHDVAQSVADAHHFNEHGRATIVHMDIKPNQWIKFDGRWMLNDFNVAKFLTWDPQTKKNCGLASGYSEGRVSNWMLYIFTYPYEHWYLTLVSLTSSYSCVVASSGAVVYQ